MLTGEVSFGFALQQIEFRIVFHVLNLLLQTNP